MKQKFVIPLIVWMRLLKIGYLQKLTGLETQRNGELLFYFSHNQTKNSEYHLCLVYLKLFDKQVLGRFEQRINKTGISLSDV